MQNKMVQVIHLNAIYDDDCRTSKMYEDIKKKFKEVGVDLLYFLYAKGTSATVLCDVLTKALNEKIL